MPTPPDISLWIQKLAEAKLPARQSSPDLLLQLQQTLRRPVDRVLVIAADVDPDVDLLQSVARDRTVDIDIGLTVLAGMLPVQQVVVDTKAIRRFDSRYPNLDPTLLIRRYFGRRLRWGVLPTEVGVLVLDSLTAAQFGAIEQGKPVDSLPVVIDDRLSHRRLRLSAPRSATVAEVLKQASIDAADSIIVSGPLLRHERVSMTKPIGETELWLHVVPCAIPRPASACTRCGECVSACPAHIHPAALLDASQRRDWQMGVSFGLRSCIECGVCDDVCPSNLPILASIQRLKTLPS